MKTLKPGILATLGRSRLITASALMPRSDSGFRLMNKVPRLTEEL